MSPLNTAITTNIVIQRLESTDFMPLTHLRVLEHQVNNFVLTLLIGFNGEEIPEINAYWDERGKQIYLAGGKQSHENIVIAKTSTLSVSINLNDYRSDMVRGVFLMGKTTPYHTCFCTIRV